MQPAIAEDIIPRASSELERTFQDYHGMVFRTAYRLTGNAADAEDVLQTVFMRLLKRDPSAEQVEQPESYLRRAAVNASLDIIRTRQRPDSTPLEAVEHGAAETSGSELKECLRQAIAQLPGRQAEVFVLRHWEGYGNAEIERITGINRFIVAATLYRARRKLQQQLRPLLRAK